MKSVYTLCTLLAMACTLPVLNGQTVPIEGAFGVTSPTNSGTNSGFRVWGLSDTNHAVYLASPSGLSPAGNSAVAGLWDGSYRLRFRTGVAQGFLFENNTEVALVDIDADNGNLRTKGILYSESAGSNFFNGSIGIGTTSPKGKLDIRGTVRLGGNGEEMGSVSNTDRALVFFSKGANGNAINYAHDAGRIYGANSSFENYGTGGGWSNQALVLEAGNGWNEFSRWQFVLKGDGNVGVGTNTPANKLDVNGTIRAKEIIVETNWADYVFEDGYELRSLDSVASFISENRRLPGLPSAEEVAETGVSVGQSQRMLLEKIEELTLYAIQQDREIEKLRAVSRKVGELEERLARIEASYAR